MKFEKDDFIPLIAITIFVIAISFEVYQAYFEKNNATDEETYLDCSYGLDAGCDIVDKKTGDKLGITI